MHGFTDKNAPKSAPLCGMSEDGRDDLKQVLLSWGVSGDGGIPLRLGRRDGNRSESVETPVAIEECLALGLEGCVGLRRIVRPLVVAPWAYGWSTGLG